LATKVEYVPTTYVYGDCAISRFGVDALEPTCGERDRVDLSGIYGMTDGDGVDAIVFAADGVDPTTTRGDGVDAVAFATSRVDGVAYATYGVDPTARCGDGVDAIAFSTDGGDP